MKEFLEELFGGYRSRKRAYIIAKLAEMHVKFPEFRIPEDPQEALKILIDSEAVREIANGEHIERLKFFT